MESKRQVYAGICEPICRLDRRKGGHLCTSEKSGLPQWLMGDECGPQLRQISLALASIPSSAALVASTDLVRATLVVRRDDFTGDGIDQLLAQPMAGLAVHLAKRDFLRCRNGRIKGDRTRDEGQLDK